MKNRVAIVAILMALIGGLFAGAPASAEPDVTMTVSATNEDGPVDETIYILAREVNGPGNRYFPTTDGTFNGGGLTPGVWIFEFHYDAGVAGWLVFAVRATLTDGHNDLGTVFIPTRPTDAYSPLHGKVRSVKGNPISGVDVEFYARFPTVSILEDQVPSIKGYYESSRADEHHGPIGVMPGAVRPVIRPRLGTIESGPDEGRSKYVEPMTAYDYFPYKYRNTKLNLVYRPRPWLKLNGHYRTSFTYDETYMPWPSERSTIEVERVDGKVKFAAYANITKYGLKNAGGTIALEIDGKLVKNFTKLNSKDQFFATISGIAPGEHVLKVRYHAGPETRNAPYVFDLVVS